MVSNPFGMSSRCTVCYLAVILLIAAARSCQGASMSATCDARNPKPRPFRWLLNRLTNKSVACATQSPPSSPVSFKGTGADDLAKSDKTTDPFHTIFWTAIVVFSLSAGFPLYLLYYVVTLVMRHLHRRCGVMCLVKYIVIVVLMGFTMVLCYVFWASCQILRFIVMHSTLITRRSLLALCLCVLIYDPQSFGWFLRRSFIAFLNGLHGEYTNTDDMAESRAHPGRHIRRMQRMGALPADQLVEPMYLSAAIASNSDNETVATEVVHHDDDTPAEPKPIPRATRRVDVLFMLPETKFYLWFLFRHFLCTFFVAYFRACLFALEWLAQNFADQDLLELVRLGRANYPIAVRHYLSVAMPNVAQFIKEVAAEHNYNIPLVVGFRPVLPYAYGVHDLEFELNFLPEYNACYEAMVDVDLVEYLISKFLAHKDVASTLNVMLEGVRKYELYDAVDPTLVYNTVLYAYQLKKLRTRAASAARGKCEAQLVQLN